MKPGILDLNEEDVPICYINIDGQLMILKGLHLLLE